MEMVAGEIRFLFENIPGSLDFVLGQNGLSRFSVRLDKQKRNCVEGPL